MLFTFQKIGIQTQIKKDFAKVFCHSLIKLLLQKGAAFPHLLITELCFFLPSLFPWNIP